MNVLRVGYVGIRTPRVGATAAMFRDVLGLEMLKDDPEWSILQLPTGANDFLEIYDAAFDDPQVAPPDQPLFVAFIVEDVAEAHEEITDAGLEASRIVWADALFGNPSFAGFAWFFFTGPDDQVYLIEQVPA